MKRFELIAIFRSFFLFFSSISLLIGVLFFMEYTKEVDSLDKDIFSKMRICSFNLVCKEFEIDFAPLQENKLYKLQKTPEELSAYFNISGSEENALKIYLPHKKYEKSITLIVDDLRLKFFIVIAIVFLLSLLFSFYTLSPLRNALKLTEEFIKDILHDFNTPLSTLRLNAAMLHKEIGTNKKLKRIENSVENILSLQSNLKSYLQNHESQKETIVLKNLLQERVSLVEKTFQNIEFFVDVESVNIETNRDSFIRIIDNILSNAGKYNKPKGSVKILYEKNILSIVDTGLGIKNPKRVFERFYKEQERGIGIGLHIVKKLCDELDITIELQSRLGEGTTLFLNLRKIIS